jgi:hypothetical protein
MSVKKYRTIALPNVLFLRCEKVVKSNRFGYASVTELVKDGTRRRLAELEREFILTEKPNAESGILIQ